MKEIYTSHLLLEDGTYFEGKAIGKVGTTTGEICFNTGLTGYQEVFTDPSYSGQILIMTSAHIGNYGTSFKNMESDGMKISGLVVKNFSEKYSRTLADSSLDDFIIENSLVGIQGIDTRMLVRHLREKGAMNCIISSEISDKKELKTLLDKTPSMQGLELASKVTTKKAYDKGNKNAKYRVAVYDFGIKKNIVQCLNDRDCLTRVFPAKTTAEEILNWKPDGIMLSNGPGDPEPMDFAIKAIQELLKTDIPMFGICLGNQVLGLAVGMKTVKMHHGHRGQNHPVKNLQTGTCEVTSQNHGFKLEMGSADENQVEITHINLNDNSIEGIRLKGKNVFAVQYHPESSPGPHDSRYLFDNFVASIKKTLNE